MNIQTLEKAKREAQVFILRALELEREQPARLGIGQGSRLSGAVRRQSMELTRALAELRR